MTDLVLVKTMYLEPKEQESYDMMTAEVGQIVSAATSVAVSTQEEASKLAELLQRGARANAQLELYRKAIVSPLNQQVKDINALFAKLQDQLENLEMQGKVRIGAWQRQERDRIERERRVKLKEQEEAARVRQEALDKAEKAKTEKARQKALEEAQAAEKRQVQAELDMPREAPKHIKTDSGSVLGKRVWKFEVVDAALVPRSFCIPDERAIRVAVNAGTREITGVHIYEDEALAISPGR